MFQDITTLLLDPKAFKHTIDIFVDRYRDMNISVVAGKFSLSFFLNFILSFVPCGSLILKLCVILNFCEFPTFLLCGNWVNLTCYLWFGVFTVHARYVSRTNLGFIWIIIVNLGIWLFIIIFTKLIIPIKTNLSFCCGLN